LRPQSGSSSPQSRSDPAQTATTTCRSSSRRLRCRAPRW
jgi:hypothetical protein